MLWSFLLGILLSYYSLSSSSLLPNLLFTYTRKKKTGNLTDDELTLMKTVCTVCGQRKCPRHRPELNILAFQPWTNLQLTGRTNDAVEEFLNIVLKEHLYTWYKDLSKDEEFVDDLKSSLRFLASVVLRRAKKVDIAKMVSEKLIRAGLLHLHVYLKAKRTAPSGSDLQLESLKMLGSNLHCAMLSRKAELEYLRRMIQSLFPYILKPQGLHSKCTCSLVRELLTNSILLPALDAVANPDMVNNLMLIFLDNTPPPEATEPPAPMVPFLGTFAQPLAKNNSCLRLELSEVMKPEHLYSFMQFLKSEAAINVLQFCLQCDDFNKKILNPDLSQGDLVELHNMAKELYRSYCSPSALDRIKFDEDIVNELRDVVEGPSDQVIRLRTSTPLFKAYEHTYDLLENTFLPLYHQSDDYYKMICGTVVPSQTSRSTTNLQLQPRSINNNRPKKKESGLANIGTKIKGVFNKTGDMRPLPETDNFDEADTITIASCSSLDDEIPDCMAVDGTFQEFHPPDLSTWRVSIPRIGARPDPDNPRKQYFVFIIDIRRVDDVSKDKSGRASWVVARRYNEFYALESKLLEFHGELMQDYGKRDQFEQYLQKLLTKPYLKGSQLLYNFLASEDEFTTKFLPDIKLGKMMKSIIVKEKGQHLETFLQTLEQSTIAEKPRSGKPERRGSDVSIRSTSSEVLCNSVYENNAGYSTDSLASTWSLEGSVKSETSGGGEDQTVEYQDLDGIFDVLIYIDVLFFDSDSPRTDEQKKERYHKTLAEALKFLPIKLWENQTLNMEKLIVDILQQPKLNKQLSYVFLDIFIQELFPELRG
ncbi:SNX14 [Mytilus edulis]|uniref:SNX14 n=1 Tax=Mytilus edulis TaxID=6550 RepID=A0A8S3SSI8_MYTED|nr:SNX14 [Mytilus edulis]